MTAEDGKTRCPEVDPPQPPSFSKETGVKVTHLAEDRAAPFQSWWPSVSILWEATVSTEQLALPSWLIAYSRRDVDKRRCRRERARDAFTTW